MPTATQFSVSIGNQPGTLAKLCSALARGKVNIDAISVAETSDTTLVRLVATPTAAAKKALTRAKLPFSAQQVISIQVQDQPGELQRIAERLAKARINVKYVYGSNILGNPARLVIGTEDLGRTAQLLK